MRRRAVPPLLVLVGLLTVGCKGKSSCEQARDLQVAAMEKFPGPSTVVDDGKTVTLPLPPEFAELYKAQVERIKASFLPVCEALGPDKVLACVKTNLENVTKSPIPEMSSDCAALYAEFEKRIR